jgi:hypothetical protein
MASGVHDDELEIDTEGLLGSSPVEREITTRRSSLFFILLTLGLGGYVLLA